MFLLTNPIGIRIYHTTRTQINADFCVKTKAEVLVRLHLKQVKVRNSVAYPDTSNFYKSVILHELEIKINILHIHSQVGNVVQYFTTVRKEY